LACPTAERDNIQVSFSFVCSRSSNMTLLGTPSVRLWNFGKSVLFPNAVDLLSFVGFDLDIYKVHQTKA
jgi:hypothetical protein